MKFQQLQNTHATKYNTICMHTINTSCLVQESLKKNVVARPEARAEGVLITPTGRYPVQINYRCDSGVIPWGWHLFLILRKLCMCLHLTGTVFLIQNLVRVLFRFWFNEVYGLLTFSAVCVIAVKRMHVCVSSFITFFFPGTQSICLLFTLMSADVTIYETAGHQRLANMCQHHGLSLTIPLEFLELVSANIIKGADGQPLRWQW